MDQKLVKAFYRAALFLQHRVEQDGWVWSSNYLREHVRCATGLEFSNSLSPEILRELRRQHPELAPHLGIKPLKPKKQESGRRATAMDVLMGVTMTDVKTLGSCCICEKRVGVTNIVMLDQRGTVPGHGWGCVVCNLPSDGAVAVLCDECRDALQADRAKLRFVCRGYASSGERDPIEALPVGKFRHDETKHAEGD